MKNILVTGGAGFIGSNLCEFLLKQGNHVTCLDNFYSSNRSNIEEFLENSNFYLIVHNIIEPLNFDIKFDEIYHLACPASPKEYQKNPIFTLDTNYIGTKNILEFALKTGTKVLLTSTSEVYGDPLVHPQGENYWGNVNPNGIRSCYDEGKRIAETLMMDYHRQYNLPIRIARIFNTYGPRMQENDGRVVSNFIAQSLEKKPLTVYGDGLQTRSLCYISDMIDGLVQLMETKIDKIEPINLGNPEESTILDLANFINNKTMNHASHEFLMLPQDDPKVRKPNIQKAIEVLNWSPKIDLNKGLDLTIEYFRILNKIEVRK